MSEFKIDTTIKFDGLAEMGRGNFGEPDISAEVEGLDVKNILNEIDAELIIKAVDMDNIFEEMNMRGLTINFIKYVGEDEILSEIDEDDIVDYLETKGYKIEKQN